MAANFIKNRILEPKRNLRMKNGRVEFYLKIEIWKVIYKIDFEKWFEE